VYDLQWAPGVTYRDVRFRDEVRTVASTRFGQVGDADGAFAEFHRDMFTSVRLREALLSSRLVLPALDYCLKCSHPVQLLDASGSIGVTERTAYILRVRQLAVAIAQAWRGHRARHRRSAHGS
jgi:glycyl-tRNA synthetase alpha chain